MSAAGQPASGERCAGLQHLQSCKRVVCNTVSDRVLCSAAAGELVFSQSLKARGMPFRAAFQIPPPSPKRPVNPDRIINAGKRVRWVLSITFGLTGLVVIVSVCVCCELWRSVEAIV